MKLTEAELAAVVEAARERMGWIYHEGEDVMGYRDSHGILTQVGMWGENAAFVALSPRAIAQLAAENAALKEATRWRSIREDSPEPDTGFWLRLWHEGEAVKVKAVTKSILVHAGGEMKKSSALGWARGHGFWRMALQSDLWMPMPKPPTEGE